MITIDKMKSSMLASHALNVAVSTVVTRMMWKAIDEKAKADSVGELRRQTNHLETKEKPASHCEGCWARQQLRDVTNVPRG